MGYNKDQGYIPLSIDTIMSDLRVKINEQFGTNYTQASFIGTNFYKYYYGLAQRMQQSEVKTSEIFLKLQDYISQTNEKISRPVNTNTGIVDKMAVEGYIASVKPMIVADAGMINICVDVDDTAPDYAATKLAICTLISQITVGGGVTQGDQSETLVLSNGQAFDFKFHLPDKTAIELRLTITTSENNQLALDTPEVIKQRLFDNLTERYRLGLNFEPQKYFNIENDAPWAGEVLLEYSTDGGTNWSSDVFDANFDSLYTFGLDDIELVEV